MRIVFVSSEVVPFSKTGGLADVAGALPKALADRGHEVHVITPLYRSVAEEFRPESSGRTIDVPVGSDLVEGELYSLRLPGSRARVEFIGNEEFFDRKGLYGDEKGDYRDNCSRFVFFSRGVLEAIEELELAPDVIHANDWQSGLVPVYRRLAYEESEAVSKAATVFTIHNMAYQGLFWHWDIPLTNIGWEHFNYKELEFYGKISFLKGGIVYSDRITTVSATYAGEIQADEEMGAGLDGVLRERSGDLVGILNGIDYSAWNPETDELIPAHYSAQDRSGKAKCRSKLLKEAGLPKREGVPLVGMVTRLADQKGLDILADAIGDMMREELQLVILGTGLPKYHALLEEVAEQYPDRAGVFLKFDNRLAHLIEAGSDMFLMPSRYEPCGLNQMISLRYGTVPVVRATGGLADTITDATDENVREGLANGFSFRSYDAESLLEAVKRAVTAYENRSLWEQLVTTGMNQDWSWDRSAAVYEELYRSITD